MARSTSREILFLSSVPGDAALAAVLLFQAAARKLGVSVRTFWLETDAPDLDRVFADIARERPDGLVVQPYPMTAALAARIAELSIRHRLPSIGGGRYFVQDGGLVSYGADSKAAWRAAARYVDQILKGAKPADLAVDQIDAIELVVNLRTAKALGIDIPPALTARANDVIR